MSVSDLVAKRMEVQKQILINPADIEAHKALNYIQQQVRMISVLIVMDELYDIIYIFWQTSMWAESQVKDDLELALKTVKFH